MTRITVGNGVYIITEIRREPPPIPAAPRSRGFVLFLLMLFVLFVAGLGMFNVWLSGQCVMTGYRISSTLEEKGNLQRQKDVLSAQVLELRNPSRIDEIARNQLGMVDPGGVAQ